MVRLGAGPFGAGRAGCKGKGGGKGGVAHGHKGYGNMVELLESYGGFRKEERCWLHAANQEKFAPNV